ncbi:MAG: flagellar basal body P-ring formation chaperone FlgA [Gemmataceae bacterium]
MRLLGTIIIALGLVAGHTHATPPEGGLVIVTLRPAATVDDAVVRVRDVASVEGGSAGLGERIARLDVAELKAGDSHVITREQVFYRLLIAGLDKRSFRVVGPAHLSVRLNAAPASKESGVVESARQAIRASLPSDAENVTLRPLGTPSLPPGLPPAARLTFAAEIEGKRTSGRVRVDVSVLDGDRKVASVPVFFDVSFMAHVAVARRRLPLGETIPAEAIGSERALQSKGEGYISAAEARGKTVRATLEPGAKISADDLKETTSDEAPVVKTRDLVRLVAQAGPVSVTARGEAMQDGRIGDMIRVRNVDSSKVVSGRVIDRNIVRVEY